MPATPAPIDALLAHADWTRALARRLIRDAHLADDLAQSAWVAAMESPPSPDRPLRRWIAAVLRSRAVDHRRRAASAALREAASARREAQPSTLDVVERLAIQRSLVEALARLEEPYRTAILLRFFEGLPPREIARRTAAPVATVRTRLARGIERLRALLDGLHGGDRRAWVVALAPMGAAPGGLLGTVIGAGIVNAKLIGVTLAAAALLLAGWLWSSARPEPAETARTVGNVASADGAAAVPAVVAAGAEGARAAAAAPPAASPEIGGAPSLPRSVPAAAARRIRGRVVDLESRAIAGVEVRIQRAGGAARAAASSPAEPTPAAVSDAHGRFDIVDPPAGSLAVDSPRYTTVLAPVVDPGATAEALVVAAPRITLGGSVAEIDGAPVERARVAIRLPVDFRAAFREVLDLSGDREWTTATDAAGRFEIADAPLVPGATLSASGAGFEAASAPMPDASTWSLSFTLRKPEARKGWVRGRVVDLSNRPVAEAWVGLDHGGAVQSDRDGRFDLHVGIGRTMSVTAAKAGHLPAIRDVRMDADGNLTPSEDLVLRLGERPLEISGAVVDADGKPVARARVWIGDGTERHWNDWTYPVLESVLAGAPDGRIVDADAQGAFRLGGLLPREYRIEALNPRNLVVGRLERVAAGRADVRIELPADAVHRRVAGRVESRTGEPVAGVVVQAARVTFRTSRMVQSADVPETVTDAQGRFELRDVAREDVYLKVASDAIFPTSVSAPFATPEDVRIAVSRRCHLQLELASPDEKLTGFAVLDAAGTRLMIGSFRGPMTVMVKTASIDAGRSAVVGVEESAATLVLMKGDEEARRLPLALKPGELTVLRP